jgi:replicative DNA helicase
MLNAHRISNSEAEAEVIGAIFYDNKSFYEVFDFLVVEDFYVDKHKLIYSAMRELYKDNKPIDIPTMADRLASTLSVIGGIHYLSQLATSSYTSERIRTYGEIIKEKSNTRKLIQLLRASLKQTEETNDSCHNIVSSLQDKIVSMQVGDTRSWGVNAFEELNAVLEDLERRWNAGGGIPGKATGYKKLDKAFGGYKKQDLVILAGRPSMGKSAVALNLALRTAAEGTKIAMFSLEMSKRQYYYRMMANLTPIELNSLSTAKFPEEQWLPITNSVNSLYHSNIYIYDNILTLNGIIAECKRLKIQKDIEVVFIDYLQIIASERNSENRNQDITKMSRAFKLLAKELDITIVLLSQLSRAPELREDHRPMMSDLRESGAIEQDADIVMFVYRDYYYNPQGEKEKEIEIIIGKNRNGEVGTVKLHWDGALQRLE